MTEIKELLRKTKTQMISARITEDTRAKIDYLKARNISLTKVLEEAVDEIYYAVTSADLDRPKG